MRFATRESSPSRATCWKERLSSVRDGAIEAVGKEVKAPPDALVIDGKGLTVYAGFIDAFSTWGFDAAQRRSAIGTPTKEDFASEALAATQSDNRKGMTPEFVVSDRPHDRQRQGRCLAEARVHRSFDRSRGRFHRGAERPGQPERGSVP